jgi:dephospho-CoA kinase
MIVLGLTGSIAMGKSTAATMFRRLGVPVHDADRAVHRLLGPGGAAVALVDAAFPGVVHGGSVDRPVLAARVFADRAALARLEAILHPLVEADQHRFVGTAARAGWRLVVLDIPLLFETGSERLCDRIAVVSASRRIQIQRLRRRPGMNRPRIDAILRRQMDDREKRRRADYVIPSGLGRALTRRIIAEIVAEIGHAPRRRRRP